MTKKLKAELTLLLIALIWGSGFVVTKTALYSLSTFNFLALRFGLAFLLCALIFYKKIIHIDIATLKSGSIIGILLFSSFALQTLGLQFTSAAKSGFITGFSVVIVPIITSILIKKVPEMKNIIGVLLALVGLSCLSLDSLSGINIGDFLTLLSAFGFAMQIIAVDKYTSKVDSINLAIVQIGVVALLSTIFTFSFESPTLPNNSTTWVAILITAILATALCFILQTTMQQYTTPTNAALIYTAEPLFGAIFAYLLADELLTSTSILGCLLILFGMLVAEINFSSLFTKKEKDFLDYNIEEI